MSKEILALTLATMVLLSGGGVEAKLPKSVVGPYLPPLLVRNARTYFQPIKRGAYDSDEQPNFGRVVNPPLYFNSDGRLYLARPSQDED